MTPSMTGPTDGLSDITSKTSVNNPKSETGTKNIKKSNHWKPILAGIVAVILVIGLFTLLRFTKFKFKSNPDKRLKDVEAPKLKDDGTPELTKE